MIKDFYTQKLPLKILFLLGAMLGALVFIGIYGVRILDFTNTGWLFYGDNDLRQHYIAWCNYRLDPWHFPIGLVDSLSYPNSVSIIYTDSIPIFAVLFKAMSPILPSVFQYFGLFGILSFMLMGGLSSILIARFTDDNLVCLIGSLFFSFSFQVIHRLYYHTALAAQWIIILSLILLVYDKMIKGYIKKIVIWGAMGFLCVGIHSYFLPMVGMIMLATMISQFCDSRKNEQSVFISCLLPVAELIAFCAEALMNLLLLGGFYQLSSATGGGLGSFGANINTFINPISFGKMLPSLPLYIDFQYEGFGYLGVGIFGLYVCIAVGLVVRRIRKVPEVAFHSSKLYGRLTMYLVVCSFLCATFPCFSYNDKKIVWFPVPQIVEKIVGIFRSNGRFIWVAVYILMLTAIIVTAYTFRIERKVAIALLAVALIVQIYDGSDTYAEKHKYFTADYPVLTLWDDPELTPLTQGKNEFIFLYNDNDVTLQTAYFGSVHGMRQNNYYYARNIDDKIDLGIKKHMLKLESGYIEPCAVYIITDAMYYSNQEFYDGLDAKKIHKYEHFMFAK